MTLDIHTSCNNDFVISLKNFDYFSEIFHIFYMQTGIFIDQYGDTKISVSQQKILIKIIEKFIFQENLNKNKEKIISILEFSGILKYFIERNIDLYFLGD